PPRPRARVLPRAFRLASRRGCTGEAQFRDRPPAFQTSPGTGEPEEPAPTRVRSDCLGSTNARTAPTPAPPCQMIPLWGMLALNGAWSPQLLEQHAHHCLQDAIRNATRRGHRRGLGRGQALVVASEGGPPLTAPDIPHAGKGGRVGGTGRSPRHWGYELCRL